MEVVFVQPGGLVDGEARGYEVSGERERERQFLSYMDLAGGMVRIAEMEIEMEGGGECESQEGGGHGVVLAAEYGEGVAVLFRAGGVWGGGMVGAGVMRGGVLGGRDRIGKVW